MLSFGLYWKDKSGTTKLTWLPFSMSNFSSFFGRRRIESHKYAIGSSNDYANSFSELLWQNGLYCVAENSVTRSMFKTRFLTKSQITKNFIFMSLLLFLSCFSGHFWSTFLVLLLLAVKRSRRTTKSDLKCPEWGLEK